MDDNKGHANLLKDLGELYREAQDYEFDDFRNKKYAAPKVELYGRLLQIAKNVQEGKYDQ